jgi:hypothetical protein
MGARSVTRANDQLRFEFLTIQFIAHASTATVAQSHMRQLTSASSSSISSSRSISTSTSIGSRPLAPPPSRRAAVKHSTMDRLDPAEVIGEQC